jgi:hypothetical protein
MKKNKSKDKEPKTKNKKKSTAEKLNKDYLKEFLYNCAKDGKFGLKVSNIPYNWRVVITITEKETFCKFFNISNQQTQI